MSSVSGSALDLYVAAANQFFYISGRIGCVCGRLLSIVYYGKCNGKILACQQSPFIILPLESNTSALWIGIERMVAMCFVVLGNIFRRVYRDCAGVCVTIFCYCTSGVASIQKAVTLYRMSSVSGSAFDLYVTAANQLFYFCVSRLIGLGISLLIHQIKILRTGIWLTASYVSRCINSTACKIIKGVIVFSFSVIRVKLPSGPVGSWKAEVSRVEFF